MSKEEYEFFVWFDKNCLTLGEMHEQFLKDNLTSEVLYLGFCNQVYDHGLDSLKDWSLAKRERAILNN